MNVRRIFQWASLAFAILAGGNELIGHIIDGPYKDIIPENILTAVMGATTVINSFLPRLAGLVRMLQVNSNEIEIKN